MATKDGKKPKFPLPRGYFGDIQFTTEQVAFYRESCQNQVQRGLLDEKAFALKGKKVNAKKWKPVRSQHNFKLFRRRDGGLHENDGKPSMLGVGRVEGSIEDALYGAYDQTDEELRMTAELVEVDFGDGIVLQNMEQGSESDMYRYLGIKWILTPFPMPALMPDRDWVLLESSGISTDADGRRYGYHTLFPAEVPQCPEFPEVIRGSMWYTFIYRDADDRRYFDCLGDLIDPITVIGSTQMFNGVFRYMESAEAKKLTILALENLERKVAMGLPPMTDKPVPDSATCSICSKNKSSNPFSSRRMRVCRVCDAIVCRNCCVKKNILVGRQRVQAKVSVCQKCIVHAKSLIVNPADEKYVISRVMQIGGVGRAHASSTASMAFDTIASGRSNFNTFMTRPALEGDESSAYSNASASAYCHGDRSGDRDREDEAAEQLSRRSFADGGGGLILHAESYQEQQSIMNSARSGVSIDLSDTTDTDDASEQTVLFAKMLELQQAAKRAHELTQANHELMCETNAAMN